jgi:cell division transport system permease protein
MFGRKPQGNRLKPTPIPPSRTTSRAAKVPSLGIRAWREQHLYSLFSSLGRLAARPTATVLTALVLGLALALPLLFWLLLSNAQGLSEGWREARDISVFLKPDLSAARADQLAAELRQRADVESVKAKSPDEGLAEFRSQSGFADALNVLTENPLPAVLVVTPKAEAGADQPPLVAELKQRSEVDLVQYDAAWRRRLASILDLAGRAVGVLAALLAFGALLVIGNTVRADVQGRGEEIAVMQLLGASSGFVRRPFLYTGVWYGALGGVTAVALVVLVELVLAGPAARLTESYDRRFLLSGLTIGVACALIAASTLLGLIGAWLAASGHLKHGQPR